MVTGAAGATTDISSNKENCEQQNSEDAKNESSIKKNSLEKFAANSEEKFASINDGEIAGMAANQKEVNDKTTQSFNSISYNNSSSVDEHINGLPHSNMPVLNGPTDVHQNNPQSTYPSYSHTPQTFASHIPSSIGPTDPNLIATSVSRFQNNQPSANTPTLSQLLTTSTRYPPPNIPSEINQPRPNQGPPHMQSWDQRPSMQEKIDQNKFDSTKDFQQPPVPDPQQETQYGMASSQHNPSGQIRHPLPSGSGQLWQAQQYNQPIPHTGNAVGFYPSTPGPTPPPPSRYPGYPTYVNYNTPPQSQFYSRPPISGAPPDMDALHGNVRSQPPDPMFQQPREHMMSPNRRTPQPAAVPSPMSASASPRMVNRSIRGPSPAPASPAFMGPPGSTPLSPPVVRPGTPQQQSITYSPRSSGSLQHQQSFPPRGSEMPENVPAVAHSPMHTGHPGGYRPSSTKSASSYPQTGMMPPHPQTIFPPTQQNNSFPSNQHVDPGSLQSQMAPAVGNHQQPSQSTGLMNANQSAGQTSSYPQQQPGGHNILHYGSEVRGQLYNQGYSHSVPQVERRPSLQGQQASPLSDTNQGPRRGAVAAAAAAMAAAAHSAQPGHYPNQRQPAPNYYQQPPAPQPRQPYSNYSNPQQSVDSYQQPKPYTQMPPPRMPMTGPPNRMPSQSAISGPSNQQTSFGVYPSGSSGPPPGYRHPSPSSSYYQGHYPVTPNRPQTTLPEYPAPARSAEHPPYEEPSKKPALKSSSQKLAALYEPADEPGRREFIEAVLRYWEEKEVPLKNAPLMGRKTLDLFRLYHIVKERGGMQEVTAGKKWPEISSFLGLGSNNSSGFTLKKQYCKYLYGYECKVERGQLEPPEAMARITEANRKKKQALENAEEKNRLASLPTNLPTQPMVGQPGPPGSYPPQHYPPTQYRTGGQHYPPSQQLSVSPSQRPMMQRAMVPPPVNMPYNHPPAVHNRAPPPHGYPNIPQSPSASSASWTQPVQNIPSSHIPHPSSLASLPHSNYQHLPNSAQPIHQLKNNMTTPIPLPTPNISVNATLTTSSTFTTTSSPNDPIPVPNVQGISYSSTIPRANTVPVSGSYPHPYESHRPSNLHARPSMMPSPSYPYSNSPLTRPYSPSTVHQPYPRSSHSSSPRPLPPFPSNSPSTTPIPQPRTSLTGVYGNSYPSSQASIGLKRPGSEVSGPPNKYFRPEMVHPPDGVAIRNRFPTPTNQPSYPGSSVGSTMHGKTKVMRSRANFTHTFPPYQRKAVPTSHPYQTLTQRTPQHMNRFRTASQSHPQQFKRQYMHFPPNSVEATPLRLTKFKRKTCIDVGLVEGWRLILALKSGLLVESSWALNTLNVLLYDQQSIGQFRLSHLPGLLDAVVEHFRRYLAEIFTLPNELKALGVSVAINQTDDRKTNDTVDHETIALLRQFKRRYHKGKNYLAPAKAYGKTRKFKIRIEARMNPYLVDKTSIWDNVSTKYVFNDLNHIVMSLSQSQRKKKNSFSKDEHINEKKTVIEATLEDILSIPCSVLPRIPDDATAEESLKSENLEKSEETEAKNQMQTYSTNTSKTEVEDDTNLPTQTKETDFKNAINQCINSNHNATHDVSNNQKEEKSSEASILPSVTNEHDKPLTNGVDSYSSDSRDAIVPSPTVSSSPNCELKSSSYNLFKTEIVVNGVHEKLSKPVKCEPSANACSADTNSDCGSKEISKTESKSNDIVSNKQGEFNIKTESMDIEESKQNIKIKVENIENKEKTLKHSPSLLLQIKHILKNKNVVLLEDEATGRDGSLADPLSGPLLQCKASSSRNELTNRLNSFSNILRSFSFIPSNTEDLCKHRSFLKALSGIILLRHKHRVKRNRTLSTDPKENTNPIYDKSNDLSDSTQNQLLNEHIEQKPLQNNSDRLFAPEKGKISKDYEQMQEFSFSSIVLNEYDNEEEEIYYDSWWWDPVQKVREDALVILCNLASSLNLSLLPDDHVALAVIEGCLHWCLCSSSDACDPTSSKLRYHISAQRLSLEILTKLSIKEDNIDLILATRPFSRIEKLFNFLISSISERRDQVLREFSIVLLSNLLQSDVNVARIVALLTGSIPSLITFLEECEETAMHNRQFFRQQAGIVNCGTTIFMMVKAAKALHSLAALPENRSKFIKFHLRLLSLSMSPLLDNHVTSIVSSLLFELTNDVSDLARANQR